MASFLNGLGSLAQGLSSFSANSAADKATQAAAAPAPAAAPAAAPDTPPAAAATPAAADPDAPPAAAAKPGAAIPAGVPANLLAIYTAAAKRTGIPVAVLVAQGKQESNFNPNAVGSAGEIGISQIKPSTAAQPGYGMKGIDPATLKDPAVNINFAADYLRARAGNGVDFANPKAVDAALTSYNGGGDKNYVANVRQHMGAA